MEGRGGGGAWGEEPFLFLDVFCLSEGRVGILGSVPLS